MNPSPSTSSPPKNPLCPDCEAAMRFVRMMDGCGYKCDACGLLMLGYDLGNGAAV